MGGYSPPVSLVTSFHGLNPLGSLYASKLLISCELRKDSRSAHCVSSDGVAESLLDVLGGGGYCEGCS